MFDLSACAKDVDLAAPTNLAALLRHVLNDRFTSSKPGFRAYRFSPATRIGKSSMPRQTKPARRCAPQQVDLFAAEPQTTTGGMALSQCSIALNGGKRHLRLESRCVVPAGSKLCSASFR